MIRHPILLALAIAGLSPLGGCTADGRYASLAPRPAELQGDAFAPVPAPSPTPVSVDPALAERIAKLAGDVDLARRAFDAAADGARASTARAKGAAAGSRAWLDAQTDLAGLDDRLSATRTAAAALDQLAAERADSGEGGLDAISMAAATAQAEVERQAALIDSLNAAIAKP